MFLFDVLKNKISIPKENEAIPGRDEEVMISEFHFVNGNPLKGPFPDHLEQIILGLGCFWGAEKAFWQLPGVFVTAVGYSAGYTANPTYQEVCSGKTGHNEVVLVMYDPVQIPLEKLLMHFFEGHNPTQGMRQGNDVGTQYRSGIYFKTQDQKDTAETYYAEDYHQQYLAKNPSGYCGLGGVGVSCPIGIDA